MEWYNLFFSLFISSVLLIFQLLSPATAETARGVVFVDQNRNGTQDSGEAGIPEVLITNQRDLVSTDAEGHWSIDIEEGDQIVLIKPSGFDFPLNELSLPKFYYIHKPKGSPTFPPSTAATGFFRGLVDRFLHDTDRDDHYPGVPPTGPLPASINFALLPQKDPSAQFDVVVMADPQPRTIEQVHYLRDDAIAEMMTEERVNQARFGVVLGDLMSNHLDLFDPYNRVMAELRKPLFNIIGNHDINFDSPDDLHSDETWHRYFGPQYYALFEGESLFVALDNIHWHHLQEKADQPLPADKKGIWDPKLGETQLAWLARLLEHHPKERLLVLMMHVPLEINSAGYISDRQALYDLLVDRKVLLLCGHLHAQDHFFIGSSSGFKGNPPIHQLTNVTLSGGWWKGRKDDRGLPSAYCIDGVDNGYTILSITGSHYTTTYKALDHSWTHQMVIRSPKGLVQPGTEILVNIFAGSEKSRVTFTVDGQTESPLERVITADPLMVQLWDEREDSDSAAKPSREVLHLWTGKLPADLSPGLHSLVIRELDQYGTLHSAASLFEIPTSGQ